MDYNIKNTNNIKEIPLPRREFIGRDTKARNAEYKKRTRKKKKSLHIIRKIFVFLIAVGFLGLFLGLGMIKGILDSTPPLTSFHFGPTAFATKITDRNGNIIIH